MSQNSTDAHVGSLKVILFALAANLGIAVAKFIGAFFSGSASLFAEAIHSLVDSTNQVLLLLGRRASAQPPDERHPLGYGREAFFWSFIVAVLLFSLGGVFAIYEGIHKIESHQPISMPWLGCAILIISIGLEAASFRACLKEVRAQSRGENLWRWFHRTTAADLLVIFTEDLAALVGLVVALAFFVLSWLSGNPVWDAVGSIAIGGILVCVSVLLAIEIKSLIIGEAPRTDYRKTIAALTEDLSAGTKILRLIALQTGGSEVMISMKLDPGSILETAELIVHINELERQVKERFPEVKWLFVEPDLYD